MATSFHCTNFSGVPENVRIVIRDAGGTLVANQLQPLNHLTTITASTKATVAYAEAQLNTNAVVSQGTAAIAATSVNIICTAMTTDAANPVATGVALRGIRFNPVPGSQE